MPTDDIQIRAIGTAPVPFDYIIPGTGQLQPKAVNATFDGTGAASAFLPTLEIISDGGVVVARCPLGGAVAAGGTAEVSWFPHVGGGAATTAGALQVVRVNIVGNQNIVEGDPGTVVTWGEAAFDTGSPTPFWSPATPTLLTAPVSGYYLSLPSPIWDLTPHPITSDMELAFYLYAGGQVPDGFHALAKESETPQGSTHFSFVGQHHAPTHFNAGDTMKINAFFDDGNGGATQASVNLLDLRVSGFTTLTTSWSVILVGAT